MKTYSHPATRQDLWLMEVFNGMCNGTALEIGGYDGITHSNTLLMEEFGWRCTLIEAVPEFFVQMQNNRPKARCIRAAVDFAWRSHKTMYVNGEWSGITDTMSAGCLDGHHVRNSKRIQVETYPLTELIPERHFTYISLDTEGNELCILADWFRAGGTCDALTLEFNYDTEKYDRACLMCDQYGMTLDRVQGFDLFFLRKP